MIGSGRLALPALEPAVAVRPIERVLVYSRSAENREAFARKASENLKVAIVPADFRRNKRSMQAEFVLVSTNSPAAAVHGQVACGRAMPIFGVGRPNEFDDDVYLRADLITVTSKAHELGYYDTKLDQPLIRLSQNRERFLGTRSPSSAIFSPARSPRRLASK